jgi:hypothetical protein
MIDLARRTVKLLSRPDIANKRWSRLQAFPTVAQLRSHCGPASCELYLRYFGIPASQVEVARAIKMEQNGTAIYRMRAFLEQAGFHTRRIEAELPLLRRLVDAQIPVIMEEDYVITGHVAVAIGYDDVREVLDVQDPMSTTSARCRRRSPSCAISRTTGRSSPSRETTYGSNLDQVGAIDCRYMSLVDQAIAAKKSANRRGSAAGRVDRAPATTVRVVLQRRTRDGRSTQQRRERRRRTTFAWTHRIVSEVVAIWPDTLAASIPRRSARPDGAGARS